jgi:aromatic ring-opening dioxygenase catalytic subunit (LigB family)
MTAWPDAPPEHQRDALRGAYGVLRDSLEAARPDTLIVLTSEHWANFFLDHIGAFCVGRGEGFPGPIEPWLNVAKRTVRGNPALAEDLIETAYANGVEPSYSYELALDHGTMVPLHFLTTGVDVSVVPIIFNTLAKPQPTAARCYAFGRIIGEVARRSPQRVGLLATGGMSHDPGERNHGTIDSAFDRRFLEAMSHDDAAALTAISSAELAAAGAGAFELLSWIALRGAIAGATGDVLLYEAVPAWATGLGVMTFSS